MKKLSMLSVSAITLATLGLMGCQAVEEKVAPNTVVAAFTSTAPDLATGAADPVWAKAIPLNGTATGGANFGGKPGDRSHTTFTLKAAYTADMLYMLYMLIQYKDPTNSVRRMPYQKQADGTWVKLVDPADKGGDDN